MNQSDKKQLVRVFRLKNNDWEEYVTGVFKYELVNDSIQIEILPDNKNKINVIMAEGDAFEKQNDRVVQIQGKLFEYEFALSFIDKALCSNLCDDLIKIKARNVSENEPTKLECNEENMLQLRDLAYKAMTNRNSSELLNRISLQEISKGLIQISKILNEQSSKEFTSRTFIFVKALLFIPNDKIADEIYKLPVLKALFVILTYDPSIPSPSRVKFLEEYQTYLTNMKEVIERNETMTHLIEYSFALVYFRDVVIARFCDDCISGPINAKLETNNKSILIETIKTKVIEKLLEQYDSSSVDNKKGVCVSIKKMCNHLLLFTPQLREDNAKLMIEQGLLKILRKGFIDENKSYCLETLGILFECCSSIGIILIKEGMLQLLAQTILTSNTSFYFGGFQLLMNVTTVIDGNVTYEREMINTMIPTILDILIQPLVEPNKIKLTNFNSYISQLAPLIIKIAHSSAISVKPYLIQSGVLSKLTRLLRSASHSTKTVILQSLRDLILLNNQELTIVLLDAGLVEIVKELLKTMEGMSVPIAEEILNSFKNRMSIIPQEHSFRTSVQTPKITDGIQDLAQLTLPPAIKRPFDFEDALNLMEVDSPSKKRVSTPTIAQ